MPEDISSNAEDFMPRCSEYDGQAAVFGWPFQELLAHQRWFVVGAGAIGCELLKVNYEYVLCIDYPKRKRNSRKVE